MGGRKFTREEENRILSYLSKWRNENPNAVEWPIEQVREGAKLPDHYRSDQVRHKISALQKKSKNQNSPYHRYNDMLNLRSRKSNGELKNTKMSTNMETISHDDVGGDGNISVSAKLEDIADQFRKVDPSKAFSGIFMFELHQKLQLGETMTESFAYIASNWERILELLPVNLRLVLFRYSRGTGHGDKLFNEKIKADLKKYEGMCFESVGDPNEYLSSDNSSEHESDIESIDMKSQQVVTNSTNRKIRPSNFLASDLSAVWFKNDWSISCNDELEPTCAIFGGTKKPDQYEKWPGIVEVLVKDPSLFNTLTEDATWKNILTKAKSKEDSVVTKLEFFRNVLPKREEYFKNQGRELNLKLQPTQKEALNLLFYSICAAKTPADIRNLFDDGLLDAKYEFQKWIFILKSAINNDIAENIFGCDEMKKREVNRKLLTLLFDGCLLRAYEGGSREKGVIERLLRNIYAQKMDFLD